MAGVTQTIPNYIQGISQQPDELKIPGQVNDALNVLPNITKGLEKRPGSEFLSTLDIHGDQLTSGKYFIIDQEEKFIGRIDKSGVIQIWDLQGNEYEVWQEKHTIYFDPDNPADDEIGPTYFRRDPYTYKPKGKNWVNYFLSQTWMDLSVQQINITNAGSGYTSAPTITIGVQWAAGVSYSENAQVFNANKLYLATNAGTSGNTAPTHTTGSVSDGAVTWKYVGTQATATATVVDGKVTNIEITNKGKGYVTATVTIAAPSSGTTATATAALYKPYLEHTGEDSIQVLNINDYTFITNRERRTEMSNLTRDTCIDDSMLDSNATRGGHEYKKTKMPGESTILYHGNRRPKEAYIELKQIAYNKQYGLNFHEKGGEQRSISRATKLSVQWWGTPVTGTTFPTLTKGPKGEIQDKNTSAAVAANADGTVTERWAANPPNETKDGACRYTAREIFTINPTGKSYLAKNDSDRNKYGPLQSDPENSFEGITATSLPYHSGSLCKPYPMNFSKDSNSGQILNYHDKLNLRFELKNTGTPKAVGEEYHCDYNVEVKLLHGGEGWKKGDYFFVVMGGSDIKTSDTPNYTDPSATNYKIMVTDHEVIGYEASLGAIRPEPTSASADETVTADGILESIMAEFDRKLNPRDMKPTYQYNNNNPRTGEGWPWHAKRIGNGIYFRMYTSDKINGVADTEYPNELDWTVTASDSKLINVLTDEVNDVGDLPTHCRHGYVVKVVNSTSDKDDYYLQFKSNSAPDDGPGVWEECVKPGSRTEFAADTMPHQLVKVNARGTRPKHFELKPIDWQGKIVGDDNTNPSPSFIFNPHYSKFNAVLSKAFGEDTYDLVAGHPIQNLAFYRNRLALLANDSIILSQPGDDFNFWAKSAMTISPADSIDLSVGDTKPATLVHSISTQKGLLLFSKEKQFLLTTDNDVLSPETAKIQSISTFNYNPLVEPFSLGTTIGFVNNVGSHTKFMEMTNISNPSQTEVIEQSKLVSSLLPTTINSVAESKEDGLVLFATSDTNEDIYGYKWFNTGEKRILASWFRWKMHGNTIFHALVDGIYYAVIRVDNQDIQLQKIDLKNQPKLDSQLVDYPLHMDNLLPLTGQTYSSSTKLTTFSQPENFVVAGNKKFTIFATAGPMKGQADYPILSEGSDFTVKGDWSTSTVYAGYTYDMKVEFPVPYLKQSEGDAVRADTRASTIIHRVDLNLGPTGYHQTRLKRKRRNDWIQNHEASLNYGFEENRYLFLDSTKTTIPVYARNGDFKLSLEANHPSPCTLYSSFWEGDYNQRYYKKV